MANLLVRQTISVKPLCAAAWGRCLLATLRRGLSVDRGRSVGCGLSVDRGRSVSRGSGRYAAVMGSLFLGLLTAGPAVWAQATPRPPTRLALIGDYGYQPSTTGSVAQLVHSWQTVGRMG